MRYIMLAAAAALMLAGCGAVGDDIPAQKNAAPSAASVTQTETSAAEPDKTEKTAETSAVTERTAASTTLPDFVTATVTRSRNVGAEALNDIRLWSDKREISTDGDSPEVIWYAEIPAECTPETVLLIDADTETIAAVLNDIADYEKYGGDIMGDSVYNCRFTVDTDIDTSPDTSETKTCHYYAEFADDKGVHRSEQTELTVYEPFTEKELGDMEAVDEEIKKLLEDEEYNKLDTDGKRERASALLHRLAAEGTAERPYPLIAAESIYESADGISYTHLCGAGSAVLFKPFPERMN